MLTTILDHPIATAFLLYCVSQVVIDLIRVVKGNNSETWFS